MEAVCIFIICVLNDGMNAIISHPSYPKESLQACTMHANDTLIL